MRGRTATDYVPKMAPRRSRAAGYVRPSDLEKCLAVALRRRGNSIRAIAEDIKRHPSTIVRWLGRSDPEAPENVAPQGPKRKSDAVAKRQAKIKALVKLRVTRAGKTRPRFSSLENVRLELARAHLITVSRQTICRDMRDLGLVNRVRPRVCTVSSRDRQRRVDWCKRHTSSSKRGYVDAARVVFSDEKIFTCNEQGSRTMYCSPNDLPLARENARWGPRIMVWGAIGKDFVRLIVLPKPKKQNGEVDELKLNSLTSQGYRTRVLPQVMARLTQERAVFMQDGARPHTAIATRKYLARKGVHVLEDWPPRSPELNPIENLWGIVAKRVSSHFPTNSDELEAALHAEFAVLQTDYELVNRLVLSFNDRCRRVVREGA